jgi:hypothetical protein
MPLPVSCSTKSQILGDYQIKKKKKLRRPKLLRKKKGTKIAQSQYLQDQK